MKRDNPDIKLIFQWVKDILGDNRKRAYFLYTDNPDKEKSKQIPLEIEQKYYLNHGIEILPYKEFDDESVENLEKQYSGLLASIKNSQGQELFKMLKYIIDRKNEKYDSAIDRFYELSKPYKKINALRVSNIIDILGEDKSCDLTTSNELVFYSDKQISNFIIEVQTIRENNAQNDDLMDNATNYKITEVIKFFQKSGANRLTASKRIDDRSIDSIALDFTEFIVDDKDESDFFWSILIFDNKSLYERVSKNNFSFVEDEYNKSSIVAYCYYRLREYKKAFEVLVSIASNLRKDNEPLLYYINQLNQYYLLLKLSWDFDEVNDKEERESYYVKLKSIDLNSLFLNLKDQDKLIAQDLNNLNFYYQDFERQIKDIKKAEDSADKRVLGGGSHHFYKIINNMFQFWRYNNLNFMILDHLSEIKVFYENSINAIIKGHSIPDDLEEYNDSFRFSRIRLDEISYFVIYIMVTKFNREKIYKLLKRNEISEIKLSDERVEGKTTFELINIAYSNILEQVKKTEKRDASFNHFNTIIAVFTFIRVGDVFFRRIINGFIDILSMGKTYPIFFNDFFIALTNFIIRQHEFFNEKIPVDEATDLLEKVILFLVKTKFDTRMRHSVDLIQDLANYLSKCDEPKIIDDQVVKNLLEYNTPDENSFETIIALYKLSSEKLKQGITEYTVTQLNSNFNSDLYYSACINQLIKPDDYYEKQFITEMTNIFQKSDNGRIWPSPIEYMFSKLINYIIACDVLDRDKFNIFRGKNDIFDLFYDPENVTFESFDVNELKKLYEPAFELLDEHPSVKEKIKKALENHIQEHLEDKEIIKIYFKFFT